MTATCTNCGSTLDDRYCGRCGQDASLALRPWRELLAEWTDAVLGWDSRTGRTLRALLFAPGHLTAEYAAGRRASWLHPLRLYLGANVVALSVFGATSARILAQYPEQFGANPVLSQFGSLMLAISAAMVVLLPAVAACHALAFRSTRRYYAEHLVFVLHLMTFLYLVEAAASLVQYLLVLGAASFWWTAAVRWIAHFAVLVYGYLAARRSYGLGGWPTLARIALVNLLSVPILYAAVWALVLHRR